MSRRANTARIRGPRTSVNVPGLRCPVPLSRGRARVTGHVRVTPYHPTTPSQQPSYTQSTTLDQPTPATTLYVPEINIRIAHYQERGLWPELLLVPFGESVKFQATTHNAPTFLYPDPRIQPVEKHQRYQMVLGNRELRRQHPQTVFTLRRDYDEGTTRVLVDRSPKATRSKKQPWPLFRSARGKRGLEQIPEAEQIFPINEQESFFVFSDPSNPHLKRSEAYIFMWL